jgi:hypothetical protein
MATPTTGGDIEALCGKCGDVWHVVAAMVGPKVVKVVCKQCGQQHRYKPVPGSAAAQAVERAKEHKAASSGRAPKTKAEPPPLTPLVAADESKPVKAYRADQVFEVGERVGHPSFGTGVVESSPGPGKVQVFFASGRRVLAAASRGRRGQAAAGPVEVVAVAAGKPQLFYVIADADCATARREVMTRGLKERVDFRNLHYEEVARDLAAHHAAAGGRGVPALPALWDGLRLHVGLAAVRAALARIEP